MNSLIGINRFTCSTAQAINCLDGDGYCGGKAMAYEVIDLIRVPLAPVNR